MALAVPQVHDFNPGVAPTGLFWTIAIPDSDVTADAARGTARYELDNVPLGDYLDVPNGLNNGPHLPAVASFTLAWAPGPHPKTVTTNDPSNGFVAAFVQGISRLAWSATEDGFRFKSDPIGTSHEVFAGVGTERNGAFYSH